MVSEKKRKARRQLVVRVVCIFLAVLMVASSLAAIFGVF